MTLSNLSPTGSRLLIVIFSICLAGCVKDFALLDDDGYIVGIGTLKITENFPSPAHLSYEGKEYTGTWSEKKIYERGLDKLTRSISDLAHKQYMLGNYPRQRKHGHVDFTAADGSIIQCDYYYRIQPDEGVCNVDGKHMVLTVAQ